tara:strand:- start:1419 stop:2543 length:1125 start_codon:yes stop_codon:yes gene_type:complete
MAYRNNPSILERDYSKTGFTSQSDVYDIIKDNVEEISEFYELEPAIVLEVFIDTDNLPTIEGSNIPDYNWLGSIRARFAYSQSESDEIEGIIKPLSSHITVYPLKGEVVNIARHGGQYYYYSPLNLFNKVNMNRAGGELGEGLVFPARTNLNRRLAPNQGDLVFNGRFGQGIKFGSDAIDYKHPNIKIINKQSVYSQQLVDEDYLHIPNINTDGSTINITSGPHEGDKLFPAAKSGLYPDKMNGDMVTINSDKLVFNAKGDPSEQKNNGDVHIFAVRNINLHSNYSININPGENGIINLGDHTSVNPILKGKETEDFLIKLFDKLTGFLQTLSNVTSLKDVNQASTKFILDIASLEKNDLPEIFSKKVFIEHDK